MARIKRWLLGSVLGILVLSVIGNHVSTVIPNPFQYVLRLFTDRVGSPAPEAWFAARVKNNIGHDLSVGTWSQSLTLWRVHTIKDGETLRIQDTGPIYLTIQGDLVGNVDPPRLTHTYEGEECYELEIIKLPHSPNDEEINLAPLNRVEGVIGGPSPKTVSFLDGKKLSFDVIGPTGIRLKAMLPSYYEGQMIFPFQIPENKKL